MTCMYPIAVLLVLTLLHVYISLYSILICSYVECVGDVTMVTLYTSCTFCIMTVPRFPCW